jgi:flagellar motor switch protein FliN/FliY
MNEPNSPGGVPDSFGNPTPVSRTDAGHTSPQNSPGVPPPEPSSQSSAPHDAEKAVEGTVDAVRRVSQAAGRDPVPEALNTPHLPNLAAQAGASSVDESIGLLDDVQLEVRIELGRTKMLVEDVLRLSADAVVELDKAAGDPVDIYVNGRRIARGEVLVLNENFCIRVSEIVEPPARTT